ncbi:MAG: adenosylcobalamin-dependent ribonucleoside-diphosphate reductase [Candidatus Dojkabacteria bacterium]|nr:adenosylcobalamin-dependent ribonucleoside-diphosphate reductase [Candidatus Dojkabacteria bacterium]
MTIFEDPFSEEIWRQTYKDYNDETIDDTLKRVAKAIASVEKNEDLRKEWEEKFYDMLSDFKVTVGGRIYSNAGTGWKGTTLINCFVNPKPENQHDSIEGIYEVLLDQAKTLKSEGGWGHNFSAIRPRGSFIKGIGVESPGAVKFMELFDKSSEIVTSGSGLKNENPKAKGKIRKGAMMGILDCWHPDIIEFVTAKQTPGRLTKFNVSVNCTDEFMTKIINIDNLKKGIISEENKEKLNSGKTVENLIEEYDVWNLEFPDTEFQNYNTEWNGDLREWKSKNYPTKIYKKISAQWLWNLILESTYNRAEPGVVFLDRANDYYSSNYMSKIVACNPCGEQMLPAGGSCNLSSLNLTQFVNKERTGFDLEKIKKYVKYLVRFLDNVNDATNLPLPEYEKFVRNMRRIGIGILGWGSALYMIKKRFASPEASELRDQIMATIARTAHEASIDLAEEKGMFEGCIPEKHVNTKYIRSLGLSEDYLNKLRRVGIRNSAVLSCQPTGNTSILANVVSGGIEPLFMHEYIRTVIVPSCPEELKDVVPKYWQGEFHETEYFKFTKEGDEDILKCVWKDGTVYKIDRNRGLTKEVLCEDYGVRYLKRIGEWDPNADWAVTALSLTVQDHINDMKGFAKWIDSAISKTVNVPYDYPFEDFTKVYLDAYKEGYIKGVTTYRTGTMTAVLSVKEEQKADQIDEEIILQDVKFPDNTPAQMKILKAEGKKWYVTVIMNNEQTKPIAFFVHTNHPEKNITTNDALDLLFDLAEKKGIPQKHIESTKSKISGDNNATKIARTISLLLRHGVLIRNVVSVLNKVQNVYVGSFLFQIRKLLSSYIKDGEKAEGVSCDNCGSSSIVYREGCFICNDCGSSKCS